MNILVINCGSSSIKFQLFDMRTYKPLIKGTLEKIGSNDSRLKLKYENIDDLEIAVKITTHNEGLEYIFNFLVNSKYKIIDSLSEIDAIGHRIVHGGEKFKESVLITDAVIDEITACIPIAPLHNPEGGWKADKRSGAGQHAVGQEDWKPGAIGGNEWTN